MATLFRMSTLLVGVLFACCFASPLIAEETAASEPTVVPIVGSVEHPLHGLEWGMTQAEVEATMPGKPTIPESLTGDLWTGAVADLIYAREEYGIKCHFECWFTDDALNKVTIRYNNETVQSKLTAKSEANVGEQLRANYGKYVSRDMNNTGEFETVWDTTSSRIRMLLIEGGVVQAPIRLLTIVYEPLPAESAAPV